MNGIDQGTLLEPGEPNEPLHDDALRKALAQAPDRATIPDWRVRQTILDHAHDAISASEELLTASREPAPWWRLAWWRDKVGFSGATPWNAALASLMVAVLVTLLWQREPVPGARPDDESPVATTPAPAAAVEETAGSKAEPAKPLPEAPVASKKESRVPAPAAPPPAPTVSDREATARTDSAARPSTESLAPAPAPAAPPAPAAVAPPVAQPAPVPDANRAGAGSNIRQTAPSAAAPAAPAARSEVAPLPDFASLSRWTELRVANVNGDVRVVPRAEAGELGLLMSSAAIMAVGGPPLRSLPEWRVSLERRGQVLAVLEMARNDVRWTEGALPPATGTPPPETMEALRGALRQAIRSGAPARARSAPPPGRAPDAGSSSGRLPNAPLAPPVPAAPPSNGAPPADPPRAPE